MTKHFQVPLRFSPRTSDPSSIGADVAPLDYSVSPADMRQSRLDGRLVLTPEIDLSRYTCRAVVDWVWLEFETREITQSVALSDHLETCFGRRPKVTGPDVDHDGKVFNVTGTVFRMKIQNPDPHSIFRLESLISGYRGLRAPIRIIGIEIALDWYARDCSDQARWGMVGTLHRHHLPKIQGLISPHADLHHTYPKADPKEGDEDKTDTAFLIHDNRDIIAGKQDSGRMFSDLDFDEQEIVRKRILRAKAHKAAYIDSTVYRGQSIGPVLFRIQNKTTDNRNPEAGTVDMLSPSEKRARVEVMLLGYPATDAGFGEVRDMIGFNFRDLRKTYFPFWLPTVPGGGNSDGVSASVRDRRLGHLLQAVFAESGVYGADLYEAVSRIAQKKRRVELKSMGEEMKAQQRIRIGERGHLIVWNEMNHRAGRAFDLLSERWSREMLQKMIPPGLGRMAA